MWLQNLRYAFRRLRRSPSFAWTAVLTLGIGIGANTTIFSVVYHVLLKPLPFAAPQQLVTARESIRSSQASFGDLPVNANHFIFWQQHSRLFSGFAALRFGSMLLQGERAEEVGIAQDTANLFTVLGVPTRLGRAFRTEEDKPGHTSVVVVTDSLWRRRLGSDRNIIGKSIFLDGAPYQVAGVLPANFALSAAPEAGSRASKPVEAFIPLGWSANVLEETEGDHNYFAIGRLKPGITVPQAASELRLMQGAISRQTPDKVALGVALTPLQDYYTGASRRSLLLLLAAVGAVLLISCVNIANLLLARAASSRREAAVRTALGASWAQLIAAGLAEPCLLSIAGCVLGVGLALLFLPVLLQYVPADLLVVHQVQVDRAALAFAVGVSLIVALGCGLLPAIRFAKVQPEATLRSESNRLSDSIESKRLRSGLVIAEVAASVALVAVAGLLIVSTIRLLNVNRGFESTHVLSADILLPDVPYGDEAKRNAFYERALDGLRRVPGVTSAGVISVLPLNGDNWGDLLSPSGDHRPIWERTSAHFRWISPGYFETLQVPLIAGRFLTDNDRGSPAALISAQVARSVWPNQSAIGQRFTRTDPGEKPFVVVGVVGDLRSLALNEPSPPMVYVPYWYRSRESASFVVRTHQSPQLAMGAVRDSLAGIDAQAAVTSTRTMDGIVSGSIGARRFEMQMLIAFAAGALLLATLGVYGVVAYSLAQRNYEIGIRMALGADGWDVRRMILAEGMMPVVWGAAAGIGLAWICGRVLTSLLFQVSAFDPLVIAGSVIILMAAGSLACVLPARRATKIEPLRALHYE